MSRASSGVPGPLLLVILLVFLAPGRALGQTAYPHSVQASAILTLLTGNYRAEERGPVNGDQYVNLGAGRGVEVQVQRRLGVSSVGLGLQYTRHSGTLENEAGEEVGDLDGDIAVFGVFVEPRWPLLSLATSNAAPYLAGRVGISRVSVTGYVNSDATGYTLNGGAGVLFRLSRLTTLDMGVTAGLRNFGTDLGVFGNALFRVGVFVGIPSGGSGS